MPLPRKDRTARLVEKVNQAAPSEGAVSYLGSVPFGARLSIDRYRLQNGLQVLLVIDPTAPVIAFHTWFNVGSRCEKHGKTGICHLFEHLMFNEVEGLKAGEFDQKMEAAGADNNASTWLDFTQYQEAFPKKHLGLVVDLESRRMSQLVLRKPQVDSEKDVVMNERRYRVEDDVDGTVEELLWKTAFQQHSYHSPTLGWMSDIEGLTTEDCQEFYRSYYAPNNASLILVGDLNETKTLKMLSSAYGKLPAFALPLEDIHPEPPQTEERRVELKQPTETEKLALGFKGPALGDPDHLITSLLIEILCGGSASRLQRRLIRLERIASDVGGNVGPHRDPSLIEISAGARDGVTAETLRTVIDEELAKVRSEPVSLAELSRARARTELALLGGLETADGKASTIGFYQTVLGRPAAAFERLEAQERVTPGDILRVARRYLHDAGLTAIYVRKQVTADTGVEADS
jgi:zinc protease